MMFTKCVMRIQAGKSSSGIGTLPPQGFFKLNTYGAPSSVR
jgi:hypothetical protein